MESCFTMILFPGKNKNDIDFRSATILVASGTLLHLPAGSRRYECVRNPGGEWDFVAPAGWKPALRMWCEILVVSGTLLHLPAGSRRYECVRNPGGEWDFVAPAGWKPALRMRREIFVALGAYLNYY